MLLLTYPTQGISVRDFLPKVIVLFCILISSLSEAQVTQDDVPIDSLENLFRNESDVVDKQRLLKALMLEASKLNAEEYYGLCPKLEKYAEEIEDNYARAVINRKKGELLYQQAEYTKAVEYFSKATEIYLSLDSLRAGYLSKLKIGVMFEKSGKPKEAFNIYHDVLKLSQNDSLIESRADANNQLGVHYFYRREIDSSRFYYEQSLELYERQLDSSGIASCLNNLGINYFMNGEVDRSEETFLKLKSLHEAQGNERQLVMVLQNLGNLNIEIANLEKALQYSTEAYNIAIKNKCKNCLPTILGGIGNIYIKTGDYEAAYNFILKAEKSVPEVDYDSRVVFLATKGQILKGLERYDEAVATLKESIAIVTEKKVQVQAITHCQKQQYFVR